MRTRSSTTPWQEATDNPLVVGSLIILAVVAIVYLRSKSEGHIPALPEAQATLPEESNDNKPALKPYLDQIEGEIDGIPYEAFLDDEELTVSMELGRPLPKSRGLSIDITDDEPAAPPESPFAAEVEALLKMGAKIIVIGEEMEDEACVDFLVPSKIIDRSVVERAARHLANIRRIAAWQDKDDSRPQGKSALKKLWEWIDEWIFRPE